MLTIATPAPHCAAARSAPGARSPNPASFPCAPPLPARATRAPGELARNPRGRRPVSRRRRAGVAAAPASRPARAPAPPPHAPPPRAPVIGGQRGRQVAAAAAAWAGSGWLPGAGASLAAARPRLARAAGLPLWLRPQLGRTRDLQPRDRALGAAAGDPGPLGARWP